MVGPLGTYTRPSETCVLGRERGFMVEGRRSCGLNRGSRYRVDVAHLLCVARRSHKAKGRFMAKISGMRWLRNPALAI